MPNKYEFNAERWLRNSAEIYTRMGSPQIAQNMVLCADEIKKLRMAVDLGEQGAGHMRDEVEALRNAGAMDVASLILAFSEKLEENPYLSFELGYTRATDWMVHIRDNRGMRNKKIVCTQHPDMAEACRDAVAELAALVGEE
jgi:hypothetical protein